METVIVGVDCAVDPARVGLALGVRSKGGTVLREVRLGSSDPPVAATIAEWIEHSRRALIAVDAPLGWPQSLGEYLHSHSAGEVIDVEPNRMFRRRTDAFVKERIGKMPLEVGADRIARTALAALNILDELRRLTGEDLPLAWRGNFSGAAAVIEVYPAGTLTSYGLPARGYKAKSDSGIRRRIIRQLAGTVRIEAGTGGMEENADALDAAVCVLAARDFLAGDVLEPEGEDRILARKEGWIWVKPRCTPGESPARRAAGAPEGSTS